MLWYGMVWYGIYVCMHACMHAYNQFNSSQGSWNSTICQRVSPVFMQFQASNEDKVWDDEGYSSNSNILIKCCWFYPRCWNPRAPCPSMLTWTAAHRSATSEGPPLKHPGVAGREPQLGWGDYLSTMKYMNVFTSQHTHTHAHTHTYI